MLTGAVGSDEALRPHSFISYRSRSHLASGEGQRFNAEGAEVGAQRKATAESLAWWRWHRGKQGRSKQSAPTEKV